jgi:hypothetical protein
MDSDLNTLISTINTSKLNILKGEAIITGYVMLYQKLVTHEKVILIQDEIRQLMRFLSVLSTCKKSDVRDLACNLLDKITLVLFKRI